MSKIGFNTLEENWTNLPLHQVLYEWVVKNISIPTEMGIIVAYLALFLIAWYSVVWVTRFIISIVWPLFLIGSAIIAYRILQLYEPDDIADIFIKSLTVVVDTVVRARYIYYYTLHQSVRIYKNIQDCFLVLYYFLFGIKESEEPTKDESLQELFVPEENFHIN